MEIKYNFLDISEYYTEKIKKNNMEIKDIFLDIDEYYQTDFKKSIIYLHHTAGGHRPDWVVNSWNKDSNSNGSTRRIATSYVVGGKSTRDGDTSWDGVIVRCFPDSKWAWHLGAKGTNGMFDKTSIGIEICNYGYLVRSKNGLFMNYVNSVVPEEQVIELKQPFRGFKYYHKYTDRQLESVRQLLIELGNKYNIPLNLGLVENLKRESLIIPNNLSVLEQQKWLNNHGYVGKNGKRLVEDGLWGSNTAWAVNSVGISAFEFNPATLTGHPGIWTHANIRKDKTDCSPQPNLISMLNSL